MRFILAILLSLCAARGQSPQTATELWRVTWNDAVVTPQQKAAVTQAAYVLGLITNRSFYPDGVGPALDKGSLYITSQPGLGWTIAETSVSGSWAHPNGRQDVILPKNITITFNSDNFNPFTGEFVEGQTALFAVSLHELLHSAIAWPIVYNGLAAEWFPQFLVQADEGAWWGVAGLAAYKSEFDPTAQFIPLDGINGWHVSENAMPLDILSESIDFDHLGYLSRTTIAMLQDAGFNVSPNCPALSITSLVNVRRIPGLIPAQVYVP